MLQHLLDHHVFLSVYVDCLGHVPALCYDELHLLLSWSPQDSAIKCVYYALHRLVVPVSSVVSSSWNGVRFVLPGLLGGSRWLYSVEVLLIEPAVVIDAVLPVVLLKVEVVVEDVLSVQHFPIFPLSLVEAPLSS